MPADTGLDEIKAASPQATDPAIEPVLIDIKQLSAMLSRSVASLHRDDAAGRLPAAVWIGSSKRWRRSEILAWVEAGCPDRKTWQALKSRNGRGGAP